MIEARCTRCEETFIPADDTDLEHVERVDGTACGGAGVIDRVVLAPGETHDPVVCLNRTGSGIRSFVGCSCGWRPRKAPEGASYWHTGHAAHRRRQGLPRLATYAYARYEDGAAAAGMTWDEWQAGNRGRDPFTGEAR